ncbi:MAG: sugar phosphate isomerase/epimerase [Nitrososphaerota archaeon]|jgi:sugar phosphate isomerase/epimerase|nr:sugar phosphate isomerase/epimerase [Nitrososphaerota archaeon]MDG6947238.1 sugar phosphate isomerase/epimerase [Nitrososphaerota archaeon]MDG6955329.1 sugar phosphate isomerase/epimerase [Nitrososphaerota archaeon]
MKLGVLTVMYDELPLEKVAKRVSELGYEAIELVAWKGGRHLDIDAVVDRGDLRVKRLAEKYGLTISALSNHMEGQLVLGPHDASTDPIYKGAPSEKVKYGIARMKKTAEAAKQLDVPVVCGFVGCPNWSAWYNFPPAYEKEYDGYFKLFAERWGEIMDKYHSEGVKFAHEVHPQEVAYNIETSELALKAIGKRKEFGFNFDPSHFVWQLIDPVQFIKKFGDRIYHSHAKDAELVEESLRAEGVIPHGAWMRPNRGFRFRVPGWGQVPWRRVFTAFAEVGYDYVMSYEHEDPVMSREDGLEKAMSFLKPLLIKERLKKVWW